MGLFRIVVYVAELTALGVIVGLSLSTVVVMGLLKGDFNGECPLYATNVGFYHPSNCNFVIGMHSVALLVAIAAGAYRLFELIKQKKLILCTYVPFMFGVAYLIFAVLVMITACIVTVGFNKFCKALTKDFQFLDCIDVQQATDILGYDVSHFYDYLLVAKTAAWLSFGMWLFVAGLTALTCTCFKNKM